ncbi:hypothetical protein [Pseudomonas protegens]|uniref:hypothetical protein n=1 Tax=Pseudomonas protegens TaxID=380021 RepID=UPI00223FE022|nr:hypothetical protein [Pseudomonas protegens]
MPPGTRVERHVVGHGLGADATQELVAVGIELGDNAEVGVHPAGDQQALGLRVVGQGVDVPGDRQAGLQRTVVAVEHQQHWPLTTASDEQPPPLFILGQGTGPRAVGILPAVQDLETAGGQPRDDALIAHRQEETTIALEQQRVDLLYRQLMGGADALFFGIEDEQGGTIGPAPADNDHLPGARLVHRAVEVALGDGDALERLECG